MFDQFWVDLQNGERVAVFVCVGLYCVLVAGYSFFKQYLVSQWPFVWGTLHKAEAKLIMPDNSLSEQQYTSKALYSYQVNGVQYEGTRVSAMVIVATHNARAILNKQLQGIQKDAAGRVKVFYKPSNPKKSLLIKGSVAQIVFTSLFFFFGVYLLVTYGPKYL